MLSKLKPGMGCAKEESTATKNGLLPQVHLFNPFLEKLALRSEVHCYLRCTFQDEFRRMLARYEVAYDERYAWDGAYGTFLQLFQSCRWLMNKGPRVALARNLGLRDRIPSGFSRRHSSS